MHGKTKVVNNRGEGKSGRMIKVVKASDNTKASSSQGGGTSLRAGGENTLHDSGKHGRNLVRG